MIAATLLGIQCVQMKYTGVVANIFPGRILDLPKHDRIRSLHIIIIYRSRRLISGSDKI
jgi:hypothetical protein